MAPVLGNASSRVLCGAGRGGGEGEGEGALQRQAAVSTCLLPAPLSPEPVWPVRYKRGLEQWVSYASRRLGGTPDSCLKKGLAGIGSWEVGHLSRELPKS